MGQTPEFLAELLNIGNASQANTIKIEKDEKKVTVIKEVDGGLQTISLKFPCIISTDLRLNEPRYASLPGIMKAKRKPLNTLNVGDLDISPCADVKIINMKLQAARKAGSIV